LALDSKAGWQKGGENGPAIVPGKPEESLLVKAVQYEDPDLAMPPKKKGGKLSDENVKLLNEWIKMGAHDPREGVRQPTGRVVRLFNLNPKSASFYSGQASCASRLSIFTRTPQHPGHPHPVLVLVNLGGCESAYKTS
jgi:hypothetical protein